ncbi:glycosyltransferase family 92 protein RCOM_0530710 [Lycium ferocissimum]|uniref:glycosyltransferase family 92 protein RCOM_0530710 n=1 Tax=Lycium ferocissimum TaxID=112874 RepID=UPI002814F7B8|nr:glycosyltransferase family 92 protein RCOM_0530710 [Lycium ferocissimum]
MDSSEQRRKRKRIIRPSSQTYLRSFILCFSFLIFLFLLSYQIPFTSSVFRPVLVVSSLSLLSSSSDLSSSSESFQDFSSSILHLQIEGRVLFPDHVLLLVNKNDLLGQNAEFECVYGRNRSVLSNIESDVIVKEKAFSVDDYGESGGMLVRCPLPPANYSAVVNLRKVKNIGVNVVHVGDENQTLNTWENVAYAATLDGNTAVVFVKGLNLRPQRESDSSQFSCHFGLGNFEKDGKFALRTKAITAAQEVVRCELPLSVRKSPEKARGIRITIGMLPHIHAKAHEKHVLLPSVAKISDLKTEGRRNIENVKYDLCMCTMVWNQASALREWITYHSWLGVERWFIYDNNSDDNIKAVVEELETENNYNVTRHVWPWIKTQEAGFSHCALRAKQECNWVSFMDVDEYFYFPYSTRTGYAGQHALRSLVANVSSSSPKIAEIRTTCHSFGPSGLNSAPSQGITVGYTCRLKSPERHKSIIRPDALDTTLLNVVHHFYLRKGFRYLNLPQSTAVINHYKYQVWEVFRAKFFRRVATYVTDWQKNQNEGSRDRAPGLGTEAIEPPNWPLQFCEVWDTGLRDFVLSNFADLSTGLLPWERSSF